VTCRLHRLLDQLSYFEIVDRTQRRERARVRRARRQQPTRGLPIVV
jgi:hypothetical protein